MTGDGWDRVPEEADGEIAVTPTDPARLRTKLRRAGFAYLNRYATSEAHFTAVMARKLERWQADGFVVLGALVAGDLVAALAEEFRDLGLIDDAGFAANRAASARAKGASRRRVAALLRQKGIDGEAAATAIASTDIDELTAALRFAKRRRFGPWRTAKAADRARVDRETAALVRQGFPYGIARQALASRIEDAEARLAEAGL